MSKTRPLCLPSLPNGPPFKRREGTGSGIVATIKPPLRRDTRWSGRDWTRHETYDGAGAIVETHGSGYGIGLAYARNDPTELIKGGKHESISHLTSYREPRK